MTTTSEITNSQQLIDSRDIIARIEELESEGIIPLDEIPQDEEANDPELAEELQHLKAMAGEAEDYAEDWKFGACLVSEEYWEDYCREFAMDIGAISKDTAWPCTCIDWEKAAIELARDYTQVDFDGVTYFVR